MKFTLLTKKRTMLKAMLIITLAFCFVGCKNKTDATSKTENNKNQDKPTSQFAVKLETTCGDIIIDVNQEWAPIGANRFYELVKSGYYTDVAFFRVIKDFMAQAGIHGNPKINDEWRPKKIADDPVIQSNTRGMVTFAMGGKNSRTTQFFINFGDNAKLDKMGFAPFGKVRDMATVDKIYAGYGKGAPRGMGPSQKNVQFKGNTYLKSNFSKLDYIKVASIIE